MENNLPKGWEAKKMLDVIDYQGGSQPPKKQFVYEPKKGYVRLLQIRDFGSNPFPTYVPDSRKLKKVKDTDILLARYGGSTSEKDSLGRVCTGLSGAYNVALAKLIFSEKELNRDYVKYLFMGPWFRNVVSKNSRSCQKGFNRDDLKDVVFPIAPLEEQKRIADKLDSLLAKVKDAQSRLEKIPTILNRFRQSVLAAAFSGELTKEWRNKNYSDVSVKNSIPGSWCWTKLGELSFSITSGSRGWAKYYSTEGAIFIRSQDIKTDSLDLNNVAHVNLPNKAEGKRTKVTKGDLLITITGANVAKAAWIDRDIHEAYVSQHVGLIRLKNPKTAHYIHLWMISSNHGRKQLLDSAYGVGKPGLNLDNLKDVDIAYPPLDEQQEINKVVEEYFGEIDKIELRYKNTKNCTDKLEQSILAKAFRGELVR